MGFGALFCLGFETFYICRPISWLFHYFQDGVTPNQTYRASTEATVCSQPIALACDTSWRVLPSCEPWGWGCPGRQRDVQVGGRDQVANLRSWMSQAPRQINCAAWHKEDYTCKYRKYGKWTSFLVSYLIDSNVSCECMNVRASTGRVLNHVHIIKLICYRRFEQEAER